MFGKPVLRPMQLADEGGIILYLLHSSGRWWGGA
ncbi:hypothetical protein BZA02_10997 [Ruegeria sp. P4]|nr:hypothetical protein BZA02_10997 [Ruegeria sp. P4]